MPISRKLTKNRYKLYREEVLILPCAECGFSGDVQPHHPIGIMNLGGTGIKAPDVLIVPLCHQCHTNFHAGRIDKWKQLEWIGSTMVRMALAGIITISPYTEWE